jgi:hypothetical protein
MAWQMFGAFHTYFIPCEWTLVFPSPDSIPASMQTPAMKTDHCVSCRRMRWIFDAVYCYLGAIGSLPRGDLLFDQVFWNDFPFVPCANFGTTFRSVFDPHMTKSDVFSSLLTKFFSFPS